MNDLHIFINGDVKNFTFSKLCKTLTYLGCRILVHTKYDKNCTIGINWFCDEKFNEVPNNIPKDLKIINRNFKSQDRYYLEPYHIEAFGYGLNVNPLTYKGLIFRKGSNHANKFLDIGNFSKEEFENDYHNKNGKPYYHLEKKGIRYMTFEGPIDKKDNNSVYQKNINRLNKDGKYIDYRLSIIDGKPFIIVKRTHDKFIIHNMFGKNIKYFYPNQLLTDNHINQIINYCNLIDLDYGDLDFLLDENNKIYICDVNNGPMTGDVEPHKWYGDHWNNYLDPIKKMINYPK